MTNRCYYQAANFEEATNKYDWARIQASYSRYEQ